MAATCKSLCFKIESYQDKNKPFKIVLNILSTDAHINRYIHRKTYVYMQETHTLGTVLQSVISKEK